MRYKLEKICCYILIIVLLPYIVTVFMNGPVVLSQASATEDMVVRVAISSDSWEETDEDGKNQSSQDISDEDDGSQSAKESEKDYMEISLTDLGIGILAREIPANYELEAIKAQAVIVRTRIYKELKENGSDTVLEEEFMTEEDMIEVWGTMKFSTYYNKLESAWRKTEGQVLIYEDNLIYAPFFKLSNGSTRDGEEVLGKEYPYLKIKECPLDIEEIEQLQTITMDEDVYLREEDGKQTDADAKTKSPQNKQSGIEVLSVDSAGYVLKVRVGEEEVNGEEFRKNYNLASSCFSVHEYEGKIRITTRGVGHGIGLSQNTANKMAESGKSAEEILKYFFSECVIREIADIVVEDKSDEAKEIVLR